MNTTSVQHKLRELDRILDTVECIRHRAPSPRSFAACGYALIFAVLAFALVPPALEPVRILAALAVGIVGYTFLAKFGPGSPSWWARLSDQLWSYEALDRQAHEALRRSLVAHATRGPRHAITQVVAWSRTELAAISSRGAGRGSLR
jgi:hypothetical protein